MGNVKFSALPPTPTVLPTDIFAITKSGQSMQSALSKLWGATPIGNAAYTIQPTDVLVYTSVAWTAPHIWTLPLASAYGAGRILRIVDSISTLSATNFMTVQRQGSDTISGATSQTLSQAGQAMLLVCDGNSTWTVVGLGQSAIGNSYQAISMSAAGNTNSTQGAVATHFMNVTVAAGALAYTGTISLPHANIGQGDVVSIYLNVAASTNPKVQIFDSSTGGTKLFEWSGDGTQTNINVLCVYNGSAWYLHDAHFWA